MASEVQATTALPSLLAMKNGSRMVRYTGITGYKGQDGFHSRDLVVCIQGPLCHVRPLSSDERKVQKHTGSGLCVGLRPDHPRRSSKIIRSTGLAWYVGAVYSFTWPRC